MDEALEMSMGAFVGFFVTAHEVMFTPSLGLA